MSVEQLDTYFSKWLALTEQQRQFILSLLTSGQFAIGNVIALLNLWYSKVTFTTEREEEPVPVEEPEVP